MDQVCGSKTQYNRKEFLTISLPCLFFSSPLQASLSPDTSLSSLRYTKLFKSQWFDLISCLPPKSVLFFVCLQLSMSLVLGWLDCFSPCRTESKLKELAENGISIQRYVSVVFQASDSLPMVRFAQRRILYS